jgi:SAM-dependent methyltransferase
MTISSYEEIPYATFALRPAYLGRLAALAHLYGVDVAAPHNCSVLEIGCGTGGNIVALAEQYPGSSFVGVDLAESHISACKMLATGCGVTNVEFRCGDIRDLSLEKGRFDYVICHGLYSWVAPDVRRALLEKISASLSPLGVAYVSYNVLPGWRQRGAVRDIMRTGAARCGVNATPRERLAAGIEFLNVVAKVRSAENDLYGSYLREAIKRFQEADESYIFHEFLEEHNEPVLFSDFMEQASAVNLQFLSEAKPSLMSSDDLGPEVARYVEGAEGDVVDREQRLDMVRNRMFRETLLCHSSLALKRDLKASVFKSLAVVTDYRHERDVSEQETIFRELVSGREVTTPHDEHAKVLALVGDAGYAGLFFNEVMDALTVSAPAIDERGLMHIIVRLWRAGFVDLMTHLIPTTSKRQGSARVSRLALYQAQQDAPLIVSLQHRSFKISEGERDVLKLSDGSRRFADVVATALQARDLREVDAAVERLLSLGFYVA